MNNLRTTQRLRWICSYHSTSRLQWPVGILRFHFCCLNNIAILIFFPAAFFFCSCKLFVIFISNAFPVATKRTITTRINDVHKLSNWASTGYCVVMRLMPILYFKMCGMCVESLFVNAIRSYFSFAFKWIRLFGCRFIIIITIIYIVFFSLFVFGFYFAFS